MSELEQPRPKISCRGITHWFRDARSRRVVQAIKGVDIDIHEREFVSIVGPSGCGKTTLLNQIAGLLRPTEGSVGSMARR